MSYEVVWKPPAEQMLTEIWLAARDRQTFTEVVAALDMQLRRNPSSMGESRETNVRLIFADPLEVLIQIDDRQRRVQINAVRRLR
jgi:hypothetical protein